MYIYIYTYIYFSYLVRMAQARVGEAGLTSAA